MHSAIRRRGHLQPPEEGDTLFMHTAMRKRVHLQPPEEGDTFLINIRWEEGDTLNHQKKGTPSFMHTAMRRRWHLQPPAEGDTFFMHIAMRRRVHPQPPEEGDTFLMHTVMRRRGHLQLSKHAKLQSCCANDGPANICEKKGAPSTNKACETAGILRKWRTNENLRDLDTQNKDSD